MLNVIKLEVNINKEMEKQKIKKLTSRKLSAKERIIQVRLMIMKL